MNLHWFINTFKNLNDRATQDVIVCHARAYIMLLLGGFLFGDKSWFRVHLKWLPLLCDFRHIQSLSWVLVVLVVL